MLTRDAAKKLDDGSEKAIRIAEISPAPTFSTIYIVMTRERPPGPSPANARHMFTKAQLLYDIAYHESRVLCGCLE